MTDAVVNLLAVDDVPENLIALEAALAMPDVRVIRAGSGREALEALLVHDVALALVDVHMPEMDGFELAELMRGAARTRQVPIIFVTADSADEARQFRGYDAGAVDFLPKPIAPHVLRSKVQVFIQLSRHRRELADRVRQLEDALAVNERFVAVLGHDLRAPLSAVATGAAVIQRCATDARVTTTATRIARSATRMGRMIDQLLSFAQARAGAPTLRRQPADLAQLWRAALDEVEPPDAARVSTTVAGDATGVWDPDRLFQVLANLLGNALHHGDPAMTIAARIDGADRAAVSLAINNGGVIPPELAPHVFEAFRTGDPRGHGLGLYVVRTFVEAHGGTVTLDSAPGRGTTFLISLPRG